MIRRGAETGSGFQEAINRTNLAYERAGRACISRKAIPGKFLLDGRGGRRGVAIQPIAAPSTMSSRELMELLAEEVGAVNGARSWRSNHRFVPESKAEPDYGGTLAPDGRAIFYDAKSTRRDLLDFDNLHDHQVAFLERMARVGAIAGFLVEFSRHGEVYFLPIQVLAKWRLESRRKSLPRTFFSGHLIAVREGKGLLIFDYLSAIAEQEARYGTSFDNIPFSP
jgi:penicillin-binding protein-related factor A (putative recombinase)